MRTSGRLPAAPLAEWVARRCAQLAGEHDAGRVAFAARVGVDDAVLRRLPKQSTVTLDLADRLLTRDGTAALWELWPELYAADPREAFCYACRTFVPAAARCSQCGELIAEFDLRRLPPSRREPPSPGSIDPAPPELIEVEPHPRSPTSGHGALDRDLALRRRALDAYASAGTFVAAGRALVAAAPGRWASAGSAAASLRALCRREGWADPDAVGAALANGSWTLTSLSSSLRPSRLRVLTEPMLEEARALYLDEGLSLRRIAERLLPQSTARNTGTLKNALEREWNRRGWPRRTYRAAATWTPPDDAGRCDARTAAGAPCSRWAKAGHRQCAGHVRDAAAERSARSARASAAANRDAVPAAPLAWWLRLRARELGSLAAVHRRLGGRTGARRRPVGGVVSYDWLSDVAAPRGRPAVRARVVRRATVDRILAAWDDGTSFNDIYFPVQDDPIRLSA